jgi:hypothetical protein
MKAKVSERYEMNLIDKQMERIAVGVNTLVEKEKRRTLINQFLKCLAADPALVNNKAPQLSTMTDLLYSTKYPLKKVFVYDYKTNKYMQSDSKPTIDLALLLNLLFKEKGLDCTFEDLMKHVLEGGNITSFLQQTDAKTE